MVFGFYIVLVNHSLWTFADSYAFGLLLVSAAEMVLVLLLSLAPRLNSGCIAASILTTILQLAILLIGPRADEMASYLTLYLFGLLAFDALLITQFTIGIASFLATRYVRESTYVGESGVPKAGESKE